MEKGIDTPVLYGFECFDLPFSVYDDLERGALYASCREPLLDLASQEWREFVSYDPVKHPSGLLGIDIVHINSSGIFECMLDGSFGDLMKNDSG